MGSLGAGSLTPRSDLDFVLIFDEGQDSFSSGPRPISARNYYAKLTQTLISAISALTPEGKLYSVDMRLRPSGKQGPVAVSIQGFLEYQMEKAWTWEHLALTRARALAGSKKLVDSFEELRRKVIAAKKNRAKILSDVAAKRERLALNSDNDRVSDVWETGFGAGRLLDLDILAHAAALLAGSQERTADNQFMCGKYSGWIDEDGINLLLSSYRLLRNVLQVARLTFDSKFRPESAGVGASELLLRETGERSIAELAQRLEVNQKSCDELILRLLEFR